MGRMKWIIIVTAVVLLALGGVGLYVLNRDDVSPPDTTDRQTQTTDKKAARVFSPQPTNDVSFTAKLTGTRTTDNVKFNMDMSYDGKGNSKAEGITGSDNMTIYNINGGFISCQGETCFELPDNQGGLVQQDQYEYDETSLKDYRDNATYRGQRDCPAGTCAAWKVV